MNARNLLKAHSAVPTTDHGTSMPVFVVNDVPRRAGTKHTSVRAPVFTCDLIASVVRATSLLAHAELPYRARRFLQL